jgi:hypothetical protein
MSERLGPLKARVVWHPQVRSIVVDQSRETLRKCFSSLTYLSISLVSLGRCPISYLTVLWFDNPWNTPYLGKCYNAISVRLRILSYSLVYPGCSYAHLTSTVSSDVKKCQHFYRDGGDDDSLYMLVLPLASSLTFSFEVG